MEERAFAGGRLLPPKKPRPTNARLPAAWTGTDPRPLGTAFASRPPLNPPIQSRRARPFCWSVVLQALRYVGHRGESVHPWVTHRRTTTEDLQLCHFLLFFGLCVVVLCVWVCLLFV